MSKSERVIHVDDSITAREALREGLSLFGINIVAQASSVEKFEELLRSGLDVTFAIIDGRMPNLGDGERAAEIARKLRPGIKIMSISSDDGLTFGDFNVLKDIGLKEISKTIEEA